MLVAYSVDSEVGGAGTDTEDGRAGSPRGAASIRAVTEVHTRAVGASRLVRLLATGKDEWAAVVPAALLASAGALVVDRVVATAAPTRCVDVRKHSEGPRALAGGGSLVGSGVSTAGPAAALAREVVIAVSVAEEAVRQRSRAVTV